MNREFILILIGLLWFLTSIVLCLKYKKQILNENRRISELSRGSTQIAPTTAPTTAPTAPTAPTIPTIPTTRSARVMPVATAVHIETLPENSILITIS